MKITAIVVAGLGGQHGADSESRAGTGDGAARTEPLLPAAARPPPRGRSPIPGRRWEMPAAESARVEAASGDWVSRDARAAARRPAVRDKAIRRPVRRPAARGPVVRR